MQGLPYGVEAEDGDKERWVPLIKQGADTLTASVIKGKGMMPPKGKAGSDADVKAAVEVHDEPEQERAAARPTLIRFPRGIKMTNPPPRRRSARTSFPVISFLPGFQIAFSSLAVRPAPRSDYCRAASFCVCSTL